MPSDVNKVSAEIAQLQDEWLLVDALMGGTKAMRAAGKKYLPKWPQEPEDSHKSRLETATLFPAYSRTVAVLTGKPFSKEITLDDDIPERIKELLDDVDLQGRNLHAFAADVCTEALAYGFCGILVDYPPNPGIKTIAAERAAGVRPYFVHIHHDAILGWVAEKVGGKTVLKQLRLLETVTEPDGEFLTKVVPQVRVLSPGAWATYRKKIVEGVEDWALYEDGLTTLNFIPFVPVYGKRKSFMVGTPPMIDLAYTNVEHWQSKSDQQTILHVARVPILFLKGIQGEANITVGAGSFIKASESDADAKYVEHSGKAIESGRLSLLDLEDRMRQIGAELLVIKPGNITEVQTMADNEQGMCDLQRIMQTLENCLDKALGFMAQWMGEKEAGHVSIYRDFGAATLAEASAQLLSDMQSMGSLSLTTLLSELKRRGILSPDIEVDDEIEAAKAEKSFASGLMLNSAKGQDSPNKTGTDVPESNQ